MSFNATFYQITLTIDNYYYLELSVDTLIPLNVEQLEKSIASSSGNMLCNK